MVFLKVLLVVIVILGLLFLGLFLKFRQKPNTKSECHNDGNNDPGISCGCGLNKGGGCMSS